ncbi:MAG: hypothetical protein KGL39_45250 [Patescibacteria group bacterium]|nr:hypothetical protein [Patescibacteria group bacterium]
MKTVDISGMDAKRERLGYEWGCQVLMFRALQWLRDQPRDFEYPSIGTYENVVGVSVPLNDSAERMTKFALDHQTLREFGPTGAMVEASLEHARQRFMHGDDAYFAMFADEPERVFDFDLREAFPEDGE